MGGFFGENRGFYRRRIAGISPFFRRTTGNKISDLMGFLGFGDAGDARAVRKFFFFFFSFFKFDFCFLLFLSTFHQKNNKPLIYKGKIGAKMIDTTNSLSPGHWDKIMSVSYSRLD